MIRWTFAIGLLILGVDAAAKEAEACFRYVNGKPEVTTPEIVITNQTIDVKMRTDMTRSSFRASLFSQKKSYSWPRSIGAIVEPGTYKLSANGSLYGKGYMCVIVTYQ